MSAISQATNGMPKSTLPRAASKKPPVTAIFKFWLKTSSSEAATPMVAKVASSGRRPKVTERPLTTPIAVATRTP
ncbi:hypothetical protein D3C74_411670 [compost metagenome]